MAIFPGETRSDFEPNVLLEMAKQQKLTGVVILGECPDGAFYFGGSYSNMRDVLWILEKAKHEMLCDGIHMEMPDSA